MPVQMDVAALTEFMKEVFPQVHGDFAIDHVGEMEITMRLLTAERHLRPGGTVSGPSMFALADVSIYLATLAMIGPKALAVTTNCAIDFMRKPEAHVDLIAKARLLKVMLGRGAAMFWDGDGCVPSGSRGACDHSERVLGEGVGCRDHAV